MDQNNMNLENTDTVRCPITIVKDVIINNNDSLNNLFIMPYEVSMMGALSHAMKESEIRDTLVNNRVDHPEDHDNLKALATRSYYYNESDNENCTSSVLAYIIMNISDLVITTINKILDSFNSNCLSATTNEKYSLLIGSDVVNGINENIVGIVKKYFEIDTLKFVEYINLNGTVNENSIMIDKIMDCVYNEIVAGIIDKIISANSVTVAASNEMYSCVCRSCYGNEWSLENDIDSASQAYRYTTISSIFREVAQQPVCDLRAALVNVSFSAANMIRDYPIFTKENYVNPFYNTLDITNANGDLKNVANIIMNGYPEGENNGIQE